MPDQHQTDRPIKVKSLALQAFAVKNQGPGPQLSPVEKKPLKSNYHHEELYAPIIAQFTASLPLRVRAIEEALQEKNWQALSDEAHKMKGAASSYGYPLLSALAAKIEESTQRCQKSSQPPAQEIKHQLSDCQLLCHRIIEGAKSLPCQD